MQNWIIFLNLSFQCSHWEGLHNRLGGFCLDCDLFAKHGLLSRLGCWLYSGLDAAQTRNSENAGLFTTFVAMSTRLLNTFEQSLAFMPFSSAIAFMICPLLI